MEDKKIADSTSTTSQIYLVPNKKRELEKTKTIDSFVSTVPYSGSLDSLVEELGSLDKYREFIEFNSNFIDLSSKDEYSEDNNNKDINKNSFGGDNMDKLLEKYIDKVDRDQSDLRSDIRSSEERISKHIELSEERNSARLDRIENMISNSIDKMDERNNRLEDKIEKTYDRLETRFSSAEEKIDSNSKFIKSFSIATVLAIAAMVVTVVFAVKSIVP